MKQKFYICRHCGNIVAMIRDKGVPIMCCGEKMHEMKPGTTEASGEKHIPVYELDGSVLHVTVGSVEHPMNQEHGIQYAHLDPDDEPRAKFAICEGDEVRAVYAFCNQHDLWRN